MKKGLYYIEPIATYPRTDEVSAEPETAMLTRGSGIDFVKIHPALETTDGGYATLNGFFFGANKEGKVSHVVRLPEEEGLKTHERIFFALCYNLRDQLKPREVVNLLADTIPHKRCWYYLEKWSLLGFYDYGVTLDLGFFYPEKIPPRYLETLEG